MYSLEERITAVKLYIEADCNESTVRTLGYPSPNALRRWYTEYLSNGKLHATSAPKPRYTDQQKAAAVEYFATHHKLSLGGMSPIEYRRGLGLI